MQKRVEAENAEAMLGHKTLLANNACIQNIVGECGELDKDNVHNYNGQNHQKHMYTCEHQHILKRPAIAMLINCMNTSAVPLEYLTHLNALQPT